MRPATARLNAFKKNILKPHRKTQWVVPPKASAEFVISDGRWAGGLSPAARRALFVGVPGRGQAKQLVRETIIPIPMKPGRAARHDDEYERNGPANMFTMSAPREGWRRVKATAPRTAVDDAHALKDLADIHFPDATKIILV